MHGGGVEGAWPFHSQLSFQLSFSAVGSTHPAVLSAPSKCHSQHGTGWGCEHHRGCWSHTRAWAQALILTHCVMVDKMPNVSGLSVSFSLKNWATTRRLLHRFKVRMRWHSACEVAAQHSALSKHSLNESSEDFTIWFSQVFLVEYVTAGVKVRDRNGVRSDPCSRRI